MLRPARYLLRQTKHNAWNVHACMCATLSFSWKICEHRQMQTEGWCAESTSVSVPGYKEAVCYEITPSHRRVAGLDATKPHVSFFLSKPPISLTHPSHTKYRCIPPRTLHTEMLRWASVHRVEEVEQGCYFNEYYMGRLATSSLSSSNPGFNIGGGTRNGATRNTQKQNTEHTHGTKHNIVHRQHITLEIKWCLSR